VKDLGIVTAKLAPNAVTSAKILDGTILVDDLANDAVETAKIKDANVTTDKLADDAVTTIKITDANVTTNKLAANAVTSAKILDGTIVVGDLANDAVETAKIKDANVTPAKLEAGNNNTVLVTDGSGVVAWLDATAFGAVADMTTIEGAGTTASPFVVKDLGIVTAKLAPNAVTSAKILDGTILVDDLANDAVETAKIKNENVTTAKLADDAVTTVKITNANVTTAKLADDAVETTKIKNANVTNDKLDKANIPLSGFAAAAADVDLGSNKLINVTDPATDQDAATKKYVDTAIASITELDEANIYVGNGSNVATPVTLSGDVTMVNGGVTTITDNAVTTAKIKNGEIINEDISATAAIVDTKLATIATAGKVSNSATTATELNTASTIVARDANGDFNAGIITAELNGNASTVTTNADLTGDVTSTGNATTITDAAVTNTKLDKANIPLSGFGAATSDVNLGGKKLTDVADPTSAQDAVTKNYLDTNFVDLTTDQTIDGVKTFSGSSTVVNQNLTVNAAGTSGQGIILSDDGDIVDNNDGAATFRFTSGVKIKNNKGVLGTDTKITLANNGDITATGSVTASQLTSNVATGNPPLVVTSTTPVANLNIGGNAATATNIAGGAAGSIPYQTAAATTAMLPKGTDGQVLTLASGIPSWATSDSGVNTLVYDGTTTYSGGGAISGNTLTLGAAKVNAPGFVSALAQTFGGVKTFTPTITAASGSAVGTAFTPNLTAAANNDALIAVDINPSFDTASKTNVATYGLRVQGIHIGKGGANIVNNTAVGIDALRKNSSNGGSNTAFGWSSLASNTDGGNNTAVGKSALTVNTTGNYNTAIGGGALVQNTASNNTAVGSAALTANTSGNDNTAIGSDAGNKITTGAKNIFIGALAGTNISSGTTANSNGTNSVMIGYDVRPLANTDDNEIVISGYNGSNGTIGLGSHSTLIGNTLTKKSQIYGALTVVPNAATSGNGNSSTIAAQNGFTNFNGGDLNLTAGNGNGSGNGGDINLNPGAKGTTGAAGKVYVNGGDMEVNGNTIGAGKYANVGNILFGTGALGSNTLGTNNIAIGQNALQNFNPASGTNSYNIAIGSSALSGTSNTSQSNIAIGPNTMDKANLSGQQNIAVGQFAMSGLKNGNFNNAFGVQAMQSSGTSIAGTENNAFGYAALKSITDGGSNSAYGSRALFSNTTGSENVAVGSFALFSNIVARNNTAVGSSALKGLNSTSNMTNEGSLNIALGYNAGRYIGSAGASDNTLGKGSLFLGYDTRPLNHNDTNEVVISGFSGTVGSPGTVGNGSNTTTIGNSATTDTYIYGNLNVTGLIKVNSTTAVLTKTITYDIAATDNANLIIFKGSNASQTIKLPAASANTGREITIKNIASVSVSVTSAGGNLVSDSTTTAATTLALGIEPSNNWIKAISDGTDWIILRGLF
ncbi:beta strand repeat-containing protein, partial [Flavobacterium sp.]|uniref:beta strand repeat-containing protein n=1 Tax=Flavobacterium sp. TaxID=239 RepID=UPI0037C0EDAA